MLPDAWGANSLLRGNSSLSKVASDLNRMLPNLSLSMPDAAHGTVQHLY